MLYLFIRDGILPFLLMILCVQILNNYKYIRIPSKPYRINAVFVFFYFLVEIDCLDICFCKRNTYLSNIISHFNLWLFICQMLRGKSKNKSFQITAIQLQCAGQDYRSLTRQILTKCYFQLYTTILELSIIDLSIMLK